MNLLSYPIGSRVRVDDPIFSKDEAESYAKEAAEAISKSMEILSVRVDWS